MIKVRIPATTANLGPGFDCLGLALNPDVPARPDAMVRRTTAADL